MVYRVHGSAAHAHTAGSWQIVTHARGRTAARDHRRQSAVPLLPEVGWVGGCRRRRPDVTVLQRACVPEADAWQIGRLRLAAARVAVATGAGLMLCPILAQNPDTHVRTHIARGHPHDRHDRHDLHCCDRAGAARSNLQLLGFAVGCL